MTLDALSYARKNKIRTFTSPFQYQQPQKWRRGHDHVREELWVQSVAAILAESFGAWTLVLNFNLVSRATRVHSVANLFTRHS